MGVIAFPNFQPQGSDATDVWRQRTISTRFKSPLTGVVTTLERFGSEWVCTPRFNNLTDSKRAVAQQFLINCRGFAQRFYLPTFYRNRGSFPAPELLTNNTFANGTTDWTFSGNFATHVADGILRTTRVSHVSTSDIAARSAAATTVQYAAYAARALDLQGNSTLFSSGPQLGTTQNGEEIGRANATGFGLKTLVATVPGTSTWFGLVDYDTGLNMAGHHLEWAYTSFARCALVDNGPNYLLRSKELDHAAWTRTGLDTVTTDTAVAPDGTTTADEMEESTANSGHGVSQSGARTSVAADLCAFGYFRRTAGTRNVRLTVGNDFANFGDVVFNLGTGAVDALSAAGTATNVRAFSFPAGAASTWYFCAVVARLPAAATIAAIASMANGTTVSYTGDGTSRVAGWGVGAAVSSMPTRGGTTVASALQSGTSQTGSGLYLKGLPVSTNGLLLAGDWVEVITGSTSQAVRARAPLNSDAAGLGYFQFEPAIRVSPLDNAGVIVCNPLIRASLDHREVEWTEHDDGFSSLEFTAVEDLS